jgi:hypothetical protein
MNESHDRILVNRVEPDPNTRNGRHHEPRPNEAPFKAHAEDDSSLLHACSKEPTPNLASVFCELRHAMKQLGLAGDLIITIEGDGTTTKHMVQDDVPDLRQALPGQQALSPRERQIVQVLATAPRDNLTVKQIAYRAHVENTSTLRAILGNLCERESPVLMSGPLGYRLVTPLGGTP